MTKEEKRKLYEPKEYALYENGRFKDFFYSHKAAKKAKHFLIKESYDDMLDLNYEIKPYKNGGN